jgi:hypothetical protein
MRTQADRDLMALVDTGRIQAAQILDDANRQIVREGGSVLTRDALRRVFEYLVDQAHQELGR